ncbi:MAG: polysaccharide biosynthesis tyrosine autokinase [Gemmatimonadaceae bacterium]|nr:polysaccharide biosynthesis tyrosine autokinase [Gemmatimonadaceae bacterium]
METLPVLQQNTTLDANSEIDLRRAWSTITRSAWIIVVSVTLAVAAALVASKRITKVYEASATLRIDDPKKNNQSGGILWNSDYGVLLATATEVLTSRSLAGAVVDSLGIRIDVVPAPREGRSLAIVQSWTARTAPSYGYQVSRTQDGRVAVRRLDPDSALGVFPDTAQIPVVGGWFRLASTAPQEFQIMVFDRDGTSDALRGSVQVGQTSKDANVLRVLFRGSDPIIVRDVPNVLVAKFVDQRLTLDRSEARGTVGYLKEQIASIDDQLAVIEGSIRDYLESQGIPGVDEAAQTARDRLGILEQRHIGLRDQRAAIAYALAPVEGDAMAATRAMVEALLATAPFVINSVGSREVDQLTNYLDHRSQLLNRRLATDPDVKNDERRILELRGVIQERAANFLSSLNAQMVDLEKAIAEQEAILDRIPSQQIEYSRMDRQRDVLAGVSQQLQSRLKEAEISAAVQDSSAQALDEALSPAESVGQSQTLIFAVAVFSGLLVGVLVAFMRDWLDTTIRTEQDLANIVGVSVVGIIPNLQQQSRAMQTYKQTSEVLTSEGKVTSSREYHTPAAEAYRTLRTNLNYLTPPRSPRVIVVTSALPGDGKTTTSVNLAVTIAHQGQRVILIDAETRRGTVHEAFGIPPAPGFFDLLYGQASPGECIRRVAMEGGGTLDVLPLGSTPSVNPADLLVAGRLQPLFERLRQQYDYVLIDTPPLNLFTDAALIGAHADALLLVARSDKTDREELQFAVAQLRNVSVTLAGAVLNDVEMRRGSRYRAGYGYYYQYGR